MIAEPIHAFRNGFLDPNEGPYAEQGGDFYEVEPDEIFDYPADTLTNIWFVCLILTGRLTEPKFRCAGDEI